MNQYKMTEVLDYLQIHYQERLKSQNGNKYCVIMHNKEGKISLIIVKLY